VVFLHTSKLSERPTGGGCLNYPLYLPGRTRVVAEFFVRGDEAGAVAELERLASLGSQDAKTVLAYLHLQGAFSTGIDFDRARDLLVGESLSDDPYALYVQGWVHFLSDKDASRAVACWIAGRERGFSPSAFELGRFLSWDLPGRPPQLAAAIDRLKMADRLGHKQAAGLIATLDAAGARGPVLAATSKPRKIFQVFRLYFWMRRDFFSSHVFARPLQQVRPFFRQQAVAVRTT
jgi:hypothetical protein